MKIRMNMSSLLLTVGQLDIKNKKQNKNRYIFAAVKLTDVIRMHKTFFDPEHVIVLEEDDMP